MGVGDGTYIVIPASILARGLSHLFGGLEVPSHLINDSQVLPRRCGIEGGTVRVTDLYGEVEMFLRVVKPVHSDIKLPEGVVAECGSYLVCSNVRQLEVEGPEVLLLRGFVHSPLLESEAFVVVLDCFPHCHCVARGGIDMGVEVHRYGLLMRLRSF